MQHMSTLYNTCLLYATHVFLCTTCSTGEIIWFNVLNYYNNKFHRKKNICNGYFCLRGQSKEHLS